MMRRSGALRVCFVTVPRRGTCWSRTTRRSRGTMISRSRSSRCPGAGGGQLTSSYLPSLCRRRSACSQ
eukprot:2895788-Rhodomonas_salina.1